MNSSQIERLYSLIGSRIKERRTACDGDIPKTQAALAELVGVSRASIVNIEKGRQHPPLHVLFDIAAALKIEPTELIPPAHVLGEQADSSATVKILNRIYQQADGNLETISRVRELVTHLESINLVNDVDQDHRTKGK